MFDESFVKIFFVGLPISLFILVGLKFCCTRQDKNPETQASAAPWDRLKGVSMYSYGNKVKVFEDTRGLTTIRCYVVSSSNTPAISCIKL